MAQDRAKVLFQQGVAAAKAGQKEQAFQILQQAVKLDPRNENVWLWLSSVARNDQERAFCLKQLLAINPQNELAIKGLQAIGVDPQQQEQRAAVPQTGIPIVTRDKLVDIQGAVDEFLKSYNPQPYTPLEIEWVHKEGKRYGEGAARRLKSSVYITGGLVAAFVLIAAIVLILTILSGEEEATQSAGATALLTSTPTTAPTATLGEPATPIPANVASAIITPTVDTSLNLPRGNVGVEPVSTDIYPVVGVPEFLGVIEDFGLGDYAAVSTFSANWRRSQTNDCYQEQYYYDAVGLAIQGGDSNIDEAENLLEEGLVAQRTGAGVINTCRDSALLHAGLCFVRYQQAILDPADVSQSDLSIAAQSCQTALADSPELVPAADTLGQIALAQYRLLNDGSLLGTAQNALLGALNAPSQPANQGNIILLMRLAEVEFASGNSQVALVYVSRVLYIDPISEEALQLQAEIHLALARSTADPEVRIARYSLAVKAAGEQYLNYYPGAAMGYALLAEARYGEGNVERAFQIANRLIAALESEEMDETNSQALQRAYQLRVAVYLDRHDWENALADIDMLRTLQPDNPQWIETHKNVVLALGDYSLVIDDIDDLLRETPTRPDLVIEKAAFLTRTCLYEDDLSCEYEDVLDDLLTDAFITSLPEDSSLRTDAVAYRLEAEFALLVEDEIDEEDEEALTARNETLQAMLTQLQEDVLAVRETGEDYYLLGRIYAELGQYPQAIAAYQWVIYWDQTFDYPFIEDVQDALDTAQDALDALADEAAEE